ncbi:MAG: glycosyltransferase family 4 protein [Geobacter sp.]
MNILFYRHTLLSRGGDRMIIAHANHLVSNGHQVTIMAAQIDSVFKIDSRVILQRLPSSNTVYTLLGALITRFPHQFIIADIIPLACLLAVRNRKHTIYYAQDYDESYYDSLFTRLLIRLLYSIGLKVMGIRTIAVAQHLADTFLHRFHVRTEVVENGIDAASFYPDPDQELIQHKENRQAILLLSRSDARKGFDVAVTIIKNLLNRKGTETLEVWTVGEACQGIFPTGVHHLDFGYVNEHRLRRIMSSANLFLYPSRHEGLPLMPLEAMACGCPVITTTAVPYAHSGKNAMVSLINDDANLLDQSILVLTNQHIIRSLINGGIVTAQRYTLERTLSSFANKLVAKTGLQL